MRGQEFQNQIIHTISQYKSRCDQLETEIQDLKSAIYQLSMLPNGIHIDVDKKKQALKANLKENRDGKKIKKSVESLVNALTQLQQKKQDNHSQLILKNHIKFRLTQLTHHLHLSKAISERFNNLKPILVQQLTTQSLSKVVDSLTDIVIEAFNLEHYQFKNFLDSFADYMTDFGFYVKLSQKNNNNYEKGILEFESEFENNLAMLRNHVEESTSLGELTSAMSNSLLLIEQQLISYSTKEKKRVEEHNTKLRELLEKFSEAECGAEKMRNQLSSHTVSINQDALTGLSSRTAYEDYLLGAYHRWERGFGDVSIAFANLDGFKEINNKYGHTIGDEILKKVAEVLRSTIRAVDFLARYEGATFVFIFERTSAHASTKVLENLRVAIEESEINPDNNGQAITLSFGSAAFKHGDTIESLVQRAEDALHEAQKGGKNQTHTLI